MIYIQVKGVGSESKSADVFTKDDEEKLWSSGVLKMFCLRGGEEHHHLKLSQFDVKRPPPPILSDPQRTELEA